MSKRMMVALALGCVVGLMSSNAQAANTFDGVIKTGTTVGQCEFHVSCVSWTNDPRGKCAPDSPLADNDINPIMQVHDIGSLAASSERFADFWLRDIGRTLSSIASPIFVRPFTAQCGGNPGNQSNFAISEGAHKTITIPKNTRWLVVWSKGEPGLVQDISYRISF